MKTTSRGLDRVLVTGGAGFLGKHLVAAISNGESELLVIDDLSVGTWSNSWRRSRTSAFEKLDLRDGKQLRRTVEAYRPNVIFHLAALHFIPACVADPELTISINVVGTQCLINACAGLSNPPLIVFASTADVYKPSELPHSEVSTVRPDNVYGITKLTGEALLRHGASKATYSYIVARLFNLYGPGETNPHVLPEIVKQLKTNAAIHLGDITPRRDFVFVEDAANALVYLAQSAPDESVWNVGTGRSHSIAEVLRVLERQLGRQIDVFTDPERMRKSDRPFLQADPTKIRTLNDGLLSTTLDDGLSRLLRAELLPSDT